MKTIIFFMICGLGFGMRIGWAQAAAAPPIASPAPPVPPPPTVWPQDVPAGQTVEPMPWNFVPPLPPSVAGKIEAPSFANDLSNSLEIGYSGQEPLQVKLRTVPYTVEAYLPPVTTHHYAIVGEVRYENVAAGTYLEMWSHFASSMPGAPDESYFSRTLGDDGPMGKLEGTHDWRGFWLPFDSTGAKGKLTQLDFNIHFAGSGTVHLSNMRVVQYPDAPLPAAQKTARSPWAGRLVIAVKPSWSYSFEYSTEGSDNWPFNFTAIQQWLDTRYKANPAARVVIYTAETVPQDEVTRVAEAAKSAGFKSVNVAHYETPLVWLLCGVSIVMLIVAGAAASVVIVLVRRSKRARHERELRRIASLDS